MYALMRTDYNRSEQTEYNSLVVVSDSSEKLNLKIDEMQEDFRTYKQPFPHLWIVSEADGDFEVLKD